MALRDLPYAESYITRSGVVAAAVVPLLLALAALYGRIRSRQLQHCQLGVDDYLCIAVAVLLLVCSAELIAWAAVAFSIKAPTDQDAAASFYANCGTMLKLFWTYNLVWCCAITLMKLAYLFTYLRIFRGKYFRPFIFGIMALVVSSGIAIFLVTFFFCHGEFDQIWNISFSAVCLNIWPFIFSSALASCILYVVLLAIPMPLVSQRF